MIRNNKESIILCGSEGCDNNIPITIMDIESKALIKNPEIKAWHKDSEHDIYFCPTCAIHYELQDNNVKYIKLNKDIIGSSGQKYASKDDEVKVLSDQGTHFICMKKRSLDKIRFVVFKSKDNYTENF